MYIDIFFILLARVLWDLNTEDRVTETTDICNENVKITYY